MADFVLAEGDMLAMTEALWYQRFGSDNGLAAFMVNASKFAFTILQTGYLKTTVWRTISITSRV